MSLPDIGLVDVVDIEETYWVGAAHELTEAGFLSKEVITTGPKGKQRVLKLLPDPDLFDIEVRQHYARTLGEWLSVVKEELEDLLDEVVALAENEKKHPLAPIAAVGVGYTAQVLAHALTTFDFDPGSPYADVYIPMNPKQLPASCCHRFGKSSPSLHDRAREVVKIVAWCAVRTQTVEPDGMVLAENLANLAQSISERSWSK